MALESFERRAVLLKAEATENVDAVPTGAADGLQLLDGSSSIEADVIERAVDRPFFGGDPFLLSKIRGSIEGDVELIGSTDPGVTAPKLSTLLRMAGMAETLTAPQVGPPAVPGNARYNPISTGVISSTAYFFHAGTLKKLTGCRASLSNVRFAIGDFPKARVQILGNSVGDVEEQAIPTVDLSGFQTPVPGTTETMTLLLNGFAVEGVELTLDFGNELGLIEHTESRLSRISDRQPTFQALFYRPLKANVDIHNLWKNHLPLALVGLIDGGVNKLSRLTIGQGQIESIEEVEQERDFAYRISGRCIPTSAGNDEFLLEFK